MRATQSPLLPPDWHALSPLIDAVLDAAPERRAALIVELSAGDSSASARLQQLVAECERDTPLLDRPATERFADLRRLTTADSPASRAPGRRAIARDASWVAAGMARVYLARDVEARARRGDQGDPPELSASLGHDRFLREIEIAARLRHPNIVPLYDSGEVGGSLYFVMPYEEGPSLRERLASRRRAAGGRRAERAARRRPRAGVRARARRRASRREAGQRDALRRRRRRHRLRHRQGGERRADRLARNQR